MRKIVIGSICTVALLAFSGCSMGPAGFLDDYATVGGKWERADPTYGRVGSAFSDPGSSVGSYATAEYEVAPYDAYGSDSMEIGPVVEGPVESFPMEGGIEIVPHYEGESIILGDEW